MLNEDERAAFLVHLNKEVHDAAARLRASIQNGGAGLYLDYPPDDSARLSAADKVHLGQVPPEALDAIEAIAKQELAACVFNVLAVIDGVGDPVGSNSWQTYQICRTSEAGHREDRFLHDDFYEKYWEYKRRFT